MVWGARSSPGNIPLSYRFTGQRWDGGIRLYNPAIIHFISGHPFPLPFVGVIL